MIFGKIIRGLQNMLKKNDYERMIGGGNVAMSSYFINQIELWRECFNGTAPWNNIATSIGIPAGICREFADISINEMEAQVTNENINTVFQRAIRDLNENLQDGLALGSFIIKPYLNGSSIGVQYVNADSFCPIRFGENGKLIDVVFVERKTVSSTRIYYRCERHRLTEDGLRITNNVFVSGSSNELGTPCPITSVPEWSNMETDITYPIFTMDFGYYRNPIKNRVDGSECGVSIFESAIEMIKRADYQAKRIDWEFESAERCLHVDERALKHKGTDISLPNRRLYRGLNVDGGTNGELFREFSPALRDTGFIAGLENYLRQIEFSVGLSYGDLSNINQVDRTAAEIRHSKQRKYNRISAIQENLKECLADFVSALAFYMQQYNSGYEFICSFRDSILTDEQTEREQDRNDVAMGVMSLAEYRAKWYGESLELAEQNLPEIRSEVIM